MQLWTVWLDSLRYLLEMLASDLGLGTGLAIVVLTLALRFALLPISWSSAYKACVRQKKLKSLQPELARLKERFGDRPQDLAERTIGLYRKNNMRIVDAGPIVGSLIQLPVLLGMFNVLRQGWQNVRFLWVASLARPDFWFALAAAATTALMMFANPDLPEQARMLMILVPSVLALVFALKFASALALYWTASNCFTAVQTFAVHRFVDRRLPSSE
ncbi:MAG: YidC/Oxa1 family membrane protein insertase [Gammaproteobacteria bacterium]|jgi:YidC/Oxa1 family membrane protein insertase